MKGQVRWLMFETPPKSSPQGGLPTPPVTVLMGRRTHPSLWGKGGDGVAMLTLPGRNKNKKGIIVL